MKKFKQSYLFCFLIILLSFLLIAILCKFNFSKIVFLSIPMLLVDFFIISGSKTACKYLYKYRFLILGIIFIILVLGKYHGSSINIWNNIIEPSTTISNNTPLFFRGQDIRSDEWAVSTPITISQLANNSNFNYLSPIVRGGNTDMFITYGGPVKDIVQISWLSKIGYLFFGEEYGLSIFWWGRLLGLFIVSFEFMMILSNKKKLISLIYASIIVCSPPIAWWYSVMIIEILLYGQLLVVLLYYFLTVKSDKIKYLIAIGLAISFLNYCMTLYPSWSIPFAIVFAIIGIHILRNNARAFTKSDLISIFLFLIIVSFIGIRIFYLSKDTFISLLQTKYPTNYEKEYLYFKQIFNWPLSILLNYYSYVDYNNLCETANFISLSPLPLILSIYYLYKNKGQNKNILYLSIFCLLLMVIVIIPLPDIFYKLTFSSSFHFSRVNIVINYINLLLFFLLLINNFKLNKKEMSIITILCIILILLSNVIVLNYYNYYLLLIATIMLFMIGIMAFDKNKQKLCLLILLFFNFISVFDVNPIARGTSVLHEKPFAKKVREIVAIDKDAKWITLNDLWLQNYLAANGAKTINTVNYYPNIDLWKKIDSNLEHAEVYNRYAHIQIIPSDETAFTIINRDAINVYLTYADLKQLNVKYIATSLEIEPDVGYPVEIRYCSENMYIYEVK